MQLFFNKMSGGWVNRMEQIMEREYEKTPVKEFNFYHADKIMKYARVIEKNRKEKPELKTAAIHLEELAGQTSELINGSYGQKILFEKKLHHIEKELRNSLSLRLKGYYVALYTFGGMAIGALAGYFVWLLFGWGSLFSSILVGWMAGLIGGQFMGGVKERKMFKQGKILQ